jgi:integrase
MTFALQRRVTNDLEKMLDWANLPEDQRKRRAYEACRDRDFETLWSLTEAFLSLYGQQGISGERGNTLRTYKSGIKSLLEIWSAVNLLDPPKDAGQLWLRTLEAKLVRKPVKGVAKTAPENERYRLEPITITSLGPKLVAVRTLYKALKWAGATSSEPFANVKLPKDRREASEIRPPYPDEDIEKLLSVALEPRDQVLILLCTHAGLRANEACHVERQHIMPNGKIHVVKAKGGKTRYVIPSKRLLRALEQCKTYGVKTGRILGWSPSRARKRLEQLCLLANVEYRALHAMRHTSGARLYREFGIEGVGAQLGHSDSRSMRRYAKINQQKLLEGVGDW